MGTLSMAQQYGPPQSNFDSSRYSSRYSSGGGGGGGDKFGFSEGFLNYLADARAMKLREKEAGIGLTGAQTGKVGAETATLYGMTDPSKAQMYAAYGSTNADLMRAGGSQTMTMKNPFGGETTTTRPFGSMAGGGYPMAGGGYPMAGGGGGGYPMAGGGGGGYPMAGGGGGGGGVTAQSIFDAYEKAQQARKTVEEGRAMIAKKYGWPKDRRGNMLPLNFSGGMV